MYANVNNYGTSTFRLAFISLSQKSLNGSSA